MKFLVESRKIYENWKIRNCLKNFCEIYLVTFLSAVKKEKQVDI